MTFTERFVEQLQDRIDYLEKRLMKLEDTHREIGCTAREPEPTPRLLKDMAKAIAGRLMYMTSSHRDVLNDTIAGIDDAARAALRVVVEHMCWRPDIGSHAIAKELAIPESLVQELLEANDVGREANRAANH